MNADKLKTSLQKDSVQAEYGQIMQDKKGEQEDKKMRQQREENDKERKLKENEAMQKRIQERAKIDKK